MQMIRGKFSPPGWLPWSAIPIMLLLGGCGDSESVQEAETSSVAAAAQHDMPAAEPASLPVRVDRSVRAPTLAEPEEALLLPEDDPAFAALANDSAERIFDAIDDLDTDPTDPALREALRAEMAAADLYRRQMLLQAKEGLTEDMRTP